MNKDLMSKEAFNELIDGLEYVESLTEYGRKNIKYYVQKLQQENKKLKMINKEYERLNKENGRGFKITNVQEYNIDELLNYKKYKDNWNKLKEFVLKKQAILFETEYICYSNILDKMQEIEGSYNSEH